MGRPSTWGKALFRRDVANTDNRGWSLYGAPWLQPVALSGKSDRRGTRQNMRDPLPWVATGCLRSSMVIGELALPAGKRGRTGGLQPREALGEARRYELVELLRLIKVL